MQQNSRRSPPRHKKEWNRNRGVDRHQQHRTDRIQPQRQQLSSNGISVLPLGAGQDVGRSCIVVSMGGKTIMLDCGMHMGYKDARKFPDFSLLLGPQERQQFIKRQQEERQRKNHQYKNRDDRNDSSITGEDNNEVKYGPEPPKFDFSSIVDCVVVSHFHLDHCGALPYFTEKVGYSGTVYMTYPTKSVAPILLEDMTKIMKADKNDKKSLFNDGSKDSFGNFDEFDIAQCMDKVVPIDLNQTIKVDDEIEIRAYYAGHVLGAAMIYIKVGDQSIVYTGDYNMTPDRHLGSAWIDKCRPDLLITESTYATTVRGSKRSREHDFLRKVHDCVAKGGKVLIPVFALGRAQELCILLEAYWERMRDLSGHIPVYFAGGLTERANEYYKLFINWTNEKIKDTFVDRNMFDFKHITTFRPEYADNSGPMVVFASPGMLHAGTSLNIFKKWCQDPKNMIILPGYCVAGTVGAKILAGDKIIEVDQFTRITMQMQVENLSFSAHADSQGILQLIRMCEPRSVMLVHGEQVKMKVLAARVRAECNLPCIYPANGESVWIPVAPLISAIISESLLKKALFGQELTKLFTKDVKGSLIKTTSDYVYSDLNNSLFKPKDANSDPISDYTKTLDAVLNVKSNSGVTIYSEVDTKRKLESVEDLIDKKPYRPISKSSSLQSLNENSIDDAHIPENSEESNRELMIKQWEGEKNQPKTIEDINCIDIPKWGIPSSALITKIRLGRNEDDEISDQATVNKRDRNKPLPPWAINARVALQLE